MEILALRLAAILSLLLLQTPTMLLASNRDLCGVDPQNPQTTINCNAGFGAALYATAEPPIAPGLSFDYYNSSCPKYRDIIRRRVKLHVKAEPMEAAGLLRLAFHDCFVQGCDASVLLNTTDGEQTSNPNRSLRPTSLLIVDEIKEDLEASCPNTVSCADILAVAGAEAVRQVKGPTIRVPVGRRDGIDHADNETTFTHLPSALHSATEILTNFTIHGLDYIDMVALSGAHSLGEAHCDAFYRRLRPETDSSLDEEFAVKLRERCPEGSENAFPMDSTPDVFDNRYFKEVLIGEAVLNSDAILELEPAMKPLVQLYARRKSHFWAQFAVSYVKMTQIDVLTGAAGNIRASCSAVN